MRNRGSLIFVYFKYRPHEKGFVVRHCDGVEMMRRRSRAIVENQNQNSVMKCNLFRQTVRMMILIWV